MPRVFYGNFDFEHELASPGYVRPKRLQRLNSLLSPALIALAEPGDSVICPEPVSERFLDALADLGLPRVRVVGLTSALTGLDGVPWGWSLSAREFLASRGADTHGPEPVAVAAVNHRQWSHNLEASSGTLIPGSRIVTSHANLEVAVREAAECWEAAPELFEFVLKPAFSMSGRGCVRGTGLERTAAEEAWVDTRIQKGEFIVFEPWIDRHSEFSLQWRIDGPAGDSIDVDCTAVTELFSTRGGQFEGIGITDDRPPSVPDELWRSAFDIQQDAARSAAGDGYRGELGIDAAVYHASPGSDTELACRPLQDVNARHTMGQVASRIAALLNAEDGAFWFRLSASLLRTLTGVATEDDAEALYARHGVRLTDAVARRVDVDDGFECHLTTPLICAGEVSPAFVLVCGCDRDTAAQIRTKLTSQLRFSSDSRPADD